MFNIIILAGALASASSFPFKNFANSSCSDSEYFCDNFECIPLSKQCDGTSDCADGSDEQDCEMYHCKPPHFFKCKNGRCLSSAFVCDAENDCGDFSDEENCEDFKKKLHQNATCPEEQWQCTDKMCIPKEWVCNGAPDCLDGSDEVLGCSPKMECEGFRCKNKHCILNEWVCDGQDDCRDNSDEENCEAKIAPSECTTENEHFLCSNNKTCIKLSLVCDNKAHCPDQSDEGAGCKEVCEDCSHTCAKFPNGPKCLCPKGYHALDAKHCQDINECEIYGICDQKCRNTQGSYECFCEENYSLEVDKKSCKAHFGEPILYFSSKKEIRAYHLRSQIYFSVGKNLKQVVGVDSDGQYVYWTDIFSGHESIVRSLKNGEKREVLVTSGLGSPEDLHIDHITRNLYFTDAERQHIGVCTNDGTHCTVLINKDIHKPRGIVLNSLEGEMYWSDWGDHPMIARAFMDGTNATPFVSTEIQWPNGLTIDHPNSRLYWTDAKLLTIESIRLDGTDRRIVLKDVVKHPYAIAVFEDRLYWSDWGTHSIESCNKFTGKNHITVVKEQKDYVYGISIFHPNNHKKVPLNSCSNAMCSDICLLKGSGHTCACPEGKELSSDGRMCKEVEKKQKLILGADNLLLEVEHKMLGKHSVEVLPAGVKSIGALAYNSIENVIYVSDVDIRKIISVNLHSGLSKVVSVGDIGNVISLDYDYLGNNLYWCDSERGTVEVFNLNTKSRTILVHDLHGEVPQSIALVPEEGVMFIAFQRLHHNSHIDRFMMDGTLRTHPIEHGTLGPVSLWYDFTLHRIFIADAGTGNIESTSIEGDDRHGFRSLQTAPIGITSLKNDIFWVDENSRDVFWADKFNTGSEILNKRITLDLPHNIEKMRIISVTPRRIGLSPCQKSNGGCSHLCLQSQQKIVCSCPIGMVLDVDNKTCIKRSDCTINEFYCHDSNLCISKKFRCDGAKNCPKGEDENDCQKPKHCPLNYFQCQDGECIFEELKCDSNYDCRDKSDERNCTQVTTKQCPLNHFQCKSKACINERLVCDGIQDCQDGDDEENCLTTVCKDKEFRCLSGACISKDWECDHDFDCPDFSDEHPGCPSCDSSMFECNNGKCIDKSFICDNENDCGDHSDETSCTKQEECKEDEFSCSVRSVICLPKSAFCNGTSECPNNEDEQNCSGDCQAEEFSCKNNKCIPKSWVCDHSDDCGDNSDEEPSFCNHTIPEQKSHFSCEGKYQCKDGQCVDFSLVCNGKNDCFDGSDEDGVCNTSCNALNNPCSHVCIKTPTGPMCKCDDGFSLQGDGQNCEDVDECENNPPPCGQICHNIPGLYLCDCYNGFALRTDRLTCKAEGKAMSIVFVSDNQIREMSQMKNSLKMIYSKDTAPITGLDASVNGTVYFSVESSGTIVRMNTTSSKVEFMEGVGQPRRISLDWLTNNVYYVDNNPLSKSISVCNFEEKSSASLIKIDPHRQVSSLVVDSANRYVFYSVVSWWMFNSPNFVIYRSNLDGTGVQELVKSSSGYITGLSLDLYKKELYFVDQHQNWLHKIKYDGTKKTLLRANLTSPNGLDFFENHVYFQSNRVMEKCRLHSPFACDSFNFKGDFFTIVQDSKQPRGINPCMNHTCSYMCVASRINYKCLCEDGKVVPGDEQCESSKRESNSNDRRKIIAIHHYQHYTGNPGPVIAGVMIAICLLIFVGLLFYVVKRRSYGSFNVIGMRFHNPGYGLQTDEAEKSIIEPGQHEYTNPVEFYEPEHSSSKKEVLVNV